MILRCCLAFVFTVLVSANLLADNREEALFGEGTSLIFEDPDSSQGDQSSENNDRFDSDKEDLEADLFGGGDSEDAIFGDEEFEGTDSSRSIVSLFGEKLKDEDSRFDIGGRANFSALILNGESQSAGESTVNTNGIVDLYFDANLEDDIRFFYQQKINQSFNGSSDLVTLVLSQLTESSDVDQLWLKFDVQDTYYITLGKQPTKLGAGFVWQPTDFLNNDRFNPLDLLDQRLGVSLLKVQIPLAEKNLNIYTIAQLNEVDRLQDIGGMFRIEYLAEDGEYGFALSSKRDNSIRAGIDMSKGAGPVDLQMSLVQIHDDHSEFYEGEFRVEDNILTGPTSVDRTSEWFTQFSVGVLNSRTVFDDKTLILNAEYFYNEAGYDDSDLLSFVIFSGILPGGAGFDPLYYSTRYAAAGATLSGLGSSRDMTSTLLVINNLDDNTGVLQLVLGSRPFRDLSMSMSAGWFFGGSGTFRPDVEVFRELGLDQLGIDQLTIQPPKFSTEIQLGVRF